MSEISETEIKSMTKEQNYIRGYKDGKFDVLDKIRAEIMKLDDINPDYPMDRTIHISRNEVLQIIDKYRKGARND